MDIVKLQETCESCKWPHSWYGNKRTGHCDYLEAQIGQDVPITRFHRCKNYLRDTAKFKEMQAV